MNVPPFTIEELMDDLRLAGPKLAQMQCDQEKKLHELRRWTKYLPGMHPTTKI
jgi:hypothetical protein